ncbi:MAG TPA: cytosine permease [Candidatus Baltobacteraceae bacterium]|nr:cytosine permease [Candidatus Baltobacteraceae bacterium]
MSEREPVYRDQVLEVEPTGIEFVRPEQRHGSPRQLFGLWFSANAEIATWMVGVFAVALYGTTLRGAALGLAVGNLIGFALLGVLATFGPRYGVPQMVASRLAFGRYGNAFPAALSFLAGVGWFAINTVFGAYALQTITRLPYGLALAIMLAAQILLAVYGYNLIHWFERVSAVLLAGGFALLGVVTFSRADWHVAFNTHAPVAAGGEIGGIILATALGFSYATGWVPCASDYSRYLPERTNLRRVWWFAFLGCVVPCIALEIMGAATVTAVHGASLAISSPTQAIASLLGSGTVATLVLLTVVLGTLTANCMNLYSGAMAALVVKFPTPSWRAPLLTAAIFGALTATVFAQAHLSGIFIVLFAAAVALVVLFVARYRLRRWRAAVVVGVLGALLASGGGHPAQTAQIYTNFLLLLSYWASPWAAVVFVDWLQRRDHRPGADAFERGPRVRLGTYAWIAGLALSLPFWNQQWFTGPFASAFPQFGDLSYYVGFAVAAAVMTAGKRETSHAPASSTT